MPLGLLQMGADHVQVEPAREGPLFEAAAALQEVQRAALEPEEVVRRAGLRLPAPGLRAVRPHGALARTHQGQVDVQRP
ncbi:hypothetical protein AB0K74_46435, partial [Streptomyces sp. NPDC056159]|uniref:hypothetical protein n=1 Tax=Streptomyces sp. NPDC056159 TaxID=3155537 RepID=UPI00343B1F60